MILKIGDEFCRTIGRTGFFCDRTFLGQQQLRWKNHCRKHALLKWAERKKAGRVHNILSRRDVHIIWLQPQWGLHPTLPPAEFFWVGQPLPVIIASNHFDWWLKDDDPRCEMHKLALENPLEGPLKIYPVSDLVNSPKPDDPRCIEPVRKDRDFFEWQRWGDG